MAPFVKIVPAPFSAYLPHSREQPEFDRPLGNQANRPIKVFHAADCANYRGEFEGWDKDRRDGFVSKLLPVIPAHELAGIVIGIRLDHLAEALKPHPELLEMFGTPYTACFQWAVSIVMEIATERGNGEKMAFVHEVNDFKGEALKAFEYVKQFLNPRTIPIRLHSAARRNTLRCRPQMYSPTRVESSSRTRRANRVIPRP